MLYKTLVNSHLPKGAIGYMKTTVTAKNFDLTKSILSFVETKFESLQEKVDKNTSIHVTLSTGREGQKAEALLYVEGTMLKMEKIDENLYNAIDVLADKLSNQVNKLTDKRNDKGKDSIRYMTTTESEGQETMEQTQPIVKRKQFDMKPMMEEEALLQMEMLGHSFFFFLNGETYTMCLLYKRKDGAYGLIEGVQ